LIRFVEHRVGDRRVIRLIRKWLKAGVMEDGEVIRPEVGTPQGGVASPLLANIYLHYVFDLWAERWRRHHAQGNIILVRYADDIVAGFEHQADAERFQAELRDRLAQFALTLHPDKTRLIQFGRRAAEERKGAGLGKPETFDFLGFTHICGRSRRGRFLLFRRTRGDRKRAKVREVKEELRRRMHDPIPSQGQWLRQVVTGFFAYHAVPNNFDALAVSTDVRKWTLFDIENWTPRVKHRCPGVRPGRLVQVVHRWDPRIAQRPPRVWRSDAREVPVNPPGQAPGHACAGTLWMIDAFSKPARRFSRSR